MASKIIIISKFYKLDCRNIFKNINTYQRLKGIFQLWKIPFIFFDKVSRFCWHFLCTLSMSTASALYASASTLLTRQESDQITATFQTKIIHKLSNGGVYIGIRSQ